MVHPVYTVTMHTNTEPHFSADGNHFFVHATCEMVHPAPDGTPVTDWSSVGAERVDPADVKVGDFVNQGAGMFTRVVEAPRPWRQFTQVKVWDEGRGGSTPFRVMRFRQGGQAWVVRAAG